MANKIITPSLRHLDAQLRQQSRTILRLIIRVSQVQRIERRHTKPQPCATTTFTPRIDGPDSPTILRSGFCDLAVLNLSGCWYLGRFILVEAKPRTSKSFSRRHIRASRVSGIRASDRVVGFATQALVVARHQAPM